MEDLLKRKKVLKTKLTRLSNSIDANSDGEPDCGSDSFSVFNEQLTELRLSLDKLFDDILATCDDTSYKIYEAEYFEVFNKLDKLQLVLRSKLVSASGATLHSSFASENSRGHIALPKINLPTFSGDLFGWISFRDLFVSMVDQNETLSAAQKLQYLKLSLKGEALALINSFQICDANYDKAWETLTGRYHNVVDLIYAHLDKFFSQPGLTKESAKGLRDILDVSSECIATLSTLKQPVNYWDSILVYSLRKKIDPVSLREWELSQNRQSIPVFEDFKKFLESRTRALESAVASTSKNVQILDRSKSAKAQAFVASSNKCVVCSGHHEIYKCNKFLKGSVADRKSTAKKLRLCFNCLKQNHFQAQCKSSGCKNCSLKHNTLLHEPFAESSAVDTNSTDIEENLVLNSTHCSNSGMALKQTLLPTALVRITLPDGQFEVCRALIDSGSEASFIREDCVQRLKLKRHASNVKISGISSVGVGNCRGRVYVELTSTVPNGHKLGVTALILPKITANLPQNNVDAKHLFAFRDLRLADPDANRAGRIDILLGADVFGEIILNEKFKAKESNLYAFHTIFGWVLTGTTAFQSNSKCAVHLVNCDIEDTIQRFWELEEVPRTRTLSPEETLCEQIFADTTRRDKNGRYIVRLPFRNNELELGSSKEMAVKRLKNSERRFTRNPELQASYKSFMEEYKDLGHMATISSQDIGAVKSSFYMPHHAVGKVVNSKTKFRIVFDASAKSSTGVSLNDKLLVGPVLQDSIAPILLRFRLHQVALTADISKMYRQFLVDERDTDFQRIVWRESPDRPMQDWKLLTVTYGTASAPWLATRCLQQLAEDEGKNFPRAADISRRDFYMDDLLTGEDTETKAIELQTEVIQLMKRGCLDIRKWTSNSRAVMEAIPEDLRGSHLPMNIDSSENVKVLGIQWNPSADYFSFTVDTSTYESELTKRSLLSNISRTFDPLGWLSPVTIRSKILMQSLWMCDLKWDDPVPSRLHAEWMTIASSLTSLEDIRIPRCIVTSNATRYELHGFADASEAAYAAVVYLKSFSQSEERSHLVIAKTKVSPLKKQSIPRLELCGALLLAETVALVEQSIKLQMDEVRCFTDSTIVLAWLQGETSRWKTFVANRVAKIKNLVPNSSWRHISSENNPADCASRGILPRELQQHPLWWSGPEAQALESQPELDQGLEEILNEQRKGHLQTHVAQARKEVNLEFLEKFSSLTKMKRVLTYCKRFLFNMQNTNKKRLGFISAKELEDAFMHAVRLVQAEVFQEEITSLAKGNNLSRKSTLCSLDPFLDQEGLLRVGGRLQHSKLPYRQKHPILLPKKHWFTERLIAHTHLTYLHAGPQLLMSILLRRFWIMGARDVIRQQVRKCVICARYRAERQQQWMGDLPTDRVVSCKPFQKTGVDYAGPFLLKASKGRGRVTYKGYVAVFICFVTRAIHLELVGDLTAEAFIAALKRFIGRRGRCTDMFSDCGTNFVGAYKILKQEKILLSRKDENRIADHLANEGITWHFNPPAAPHMGGLWEAGVKSVKHHLRRVVGQTSLCYEELYTVLVGIEACLNSRPLTPMSNNPNDLEALTPGHFLTGDCLMALPEQDLTDKVFSLQPRWKLVQRLVQGFWARWRSEYLSRLQHRPKWLTKRENFNIGDMVLLRDERLPPFQWTLGRILETHPGKDGVVRVVSVKTTSGTFQRPIVKLVHLPC